MGLMNHHLERRFASIRDELSRLSTTPLEPIAKKLEDSLLPIFRSSQNTIISGPLERLADYAELVLDRLPTSFGARFLFDSALLMTLAESWNPTLRLRRVMVPSYGSGWGYQALPLPSTDGKSAWVVDLFYFRGDEHLDSVELLDYPWLVHEFGHLLLRNYPSEFQRAFTQLLSDHMKEARLLSLADRASARKKADTELRNVVQFWSPSGDQYNWAHEIAFDVIALWTCGPAFLKAFCRTLINESPDPFHLDQSHPPYLARVNALLYAARKIGVVEELRSLEDMRSQYLTHVRDSGKTNLQALYLPSSLVHGAADVALDVAKKRSLYRVSNCKDQQRRVELGFELLALSYHHERQTPTAYPQWQRSTLQSLAADLTL